MLQSNELKIIDGKLTIVQVQVPQDKHFGVIGEITLILLGQFVGSKEQGYLTTDHTPGWHATWYVYGL